MAVGRRLPDETRFRLGMKTVRNDRKNILKIFAPVFFGREWERENESGITGYRERNISNGNVSITIGKR